MVRLYEFTNAEDQLKLLRLIIDNTWSAISKEAEQEKAHKAMNAQRSKMRPKKISKGKSISIPLPSVKPPPKVVKSPPSNTLDNPKKSLAKNTGGHPLKQAPTLNPSVIKPVGLTTKATTLPSNLPNSNQPTYPLNNHPNASSGSLGGYLGRNTSKFNSDDETDDRHSKNGINILKK